MQPLEQVRDLDNRLERRPIPWANRVRVGFEVSTPRTCSLPQNNVVSRRYRPLVGDVRALRIVLTVSAGIQVIPADVPPIKKLGMPLILCWVAHHSMRADRVITSIQSQR